MSDGSRDGDAAFARADAKAALAAYTADANARLTRAAALRLASAFAQNGDVVHASDVLDAYLDQNPRDLPALRLAGDIALAGGDWPRAAAAFARAAAMTGDGDALAAAGLGWATTQRGGDGRAALGRAVRLAPMTAVFRDRLVATRPAR